MLQTVPQKKDYLPMVGVFTNQLYINIVGAALLKHQQWRKWIGGDTNHGQIIKLPVVVSPDQPHKNNTYPALP